MTNAENNEDEKKDLPKDLARSLIEYARKRWEQTEQDQKEIINILSNNSEEYASFVFSIQQKIQSMAYEIALAAGNQPSKQVEYWLQAEDAVFGHLHKRIEERAYLLWEETGCQASRALDHWLEAERMILGPMWTCTRDVARLIWDEGRRHHGQTLEIWVMAERMVWRSFRLGLDLFPLFPKRGSPFTGGDL
ncbi:MAG: DUF2934 domain-containing protein [Defluviicoccus sp.]